ncbi:MAG: protein kinase [Lentisphaeraceae bacterium]|nr:protein kinase [Lentisphaeraceae bacterium]
MNNKTEVIPEDDNVSHVETTPNATKEKILSTFKLNKKYSHIREVGEGGMGTVTLCKDLTSYREVAVKTLHKDLLSDPETVIRFTEEAQIAAQLEHPNIIPIYDHGVNEENVPFYTMKHINGDNLRNILNKIKDNDAAYISKYPYSRLLKIVLKICDAMAYACSRGALHRDLKPENIMIGEYGEVIIVDWGLAKILSKDQQKASPQNTPADVERFLESTQINTLRSRNGLNLSLNNCLVGTPEYMPPERIFGHADEKSEVYSIGAILYSVLSLDNPFKEEDVKELIRQINKGSIKNLNEYEHLPHFKNGKIPNSLIAITQKAIDKDPDKRYDSINAFKYDLEAYLSGFIPKAEQASLVKTYRQMMLRHKKTAMTFFGSIIIIIFFASLSVSKILKEQNQAEFEAKVALELAKEAEVQSHNVEEKSQELNHKITELILSTPVLYENAENLRQNLNFKKALQNLSYAISLQEDMHRAIYLKAGILMALESFKSAHIALKKLTTVPKFSKQAEADIKLLLKVRKKLKGEDSLAAYKELYKHFINSDRTPEALHVLEKLILDPNYDSYLLNTWIKKLSKTGFSSLIRDPNKFKILINHGLFTVEINDKNLYDLSPLQSMPITELIIRRSKITNLSAVRKMPLKSLLVNDCDLNTLEDLKGKQLESLNIRNTKVTSLEPIIDLPITRLHINGTPITNLKNAAKLPLEHLDISNTRIEALFGIRAKSLINLRAANSQIRNLDILKTTKVQFINVSGSPIRSIESIGKMTRLRHLNIAATFVEDLRPLKSLNKLNNLNISNTSIRSLEGLENCQLTVFHASDTHIDSLEALKGQPIKILTASNTRIKQIEPICSPQLISLSVANLAYLSLEGLSKCTNLEELKISTTNTKSLELLNSKQLHTLEVPYNKVRSLEKLKELPNLKVLNISFNPIQDISALQYCKDLRYLTANRILTKDIRALKKLNLKYLKLYQCWSIRSLEPISSIKTLNNLSVPEGRDDYHHLKELNLKSLSDQWHDMTPATFWKKYRPKD